VFIYSFTTLKPVLFFSIELNDFDCLVYKRNAYFISHQQ